MTPRCGPGCCASSAAWRRPRAPRTAGCKRASTAVRHADGHGPPRRHPRQPAQPGGAVLRPRRRRGAGQERPEISRAALRHAHNLPAHGHRLQRRRGHRGGGPGRGLGAGAGGHAAGRADSAVDLPGAAIRRPASAGGRRRHRGALRLGERRHLHRRHQLPQAGQPAVRELRHRLPRRDGIARHHRRHPARARPPGASAGPIWGQATRLALREAVFGRSVLLLVGALVIGALCGEAGHGQRGGVLRHAVSGRAGAVPPGNGHGGGAAAGGPEEGRPVPAGALACARRWCMAALVCWRASSSA